jgi:hypothetical protein
MLTKTCHPSCNVYQRTVIGLILICIGVRNWIEFINLLF